MNSGYGKSNNKSGSANAFDFDLGLGSARSRPINDQKNPTPSYSRPNRWTSQPNKPAWTHQPAAPPAQSGMAGSLSGPTSMVGDIFGKSWNSSSSSGVSGVGIVNNKNPNLFGELLNSALGSNKSSSNVPLKNAAPVASQSAFLMGSVADSLPKPGYSGSSTGGSVNVGGNYGKSPSLGGVYGVSSGIGGVGVGGNVNLGGQSMKSMTGTVVGVGGVGSGKDPFGSLVDFGTSKPAGGMNSAATAKPNDNAGLGDDLFGGFHNATSKSSGSSFSTSDFPSSNNSNSDPLGGFVFSSSSTGSQTQPAKQQPSAGNDFDVLFSSSSVGRGGGEFATQQFTEVDDWGVNSDFGGGDDNGGTTELDGLPPPPAGVSAPSAKNKGMENYKQGQFADAIKWLSWAVVLLEKAGDDDGTMEVLTCRASCYKEVGEYKKAVADCTKALEHDGKNVSILVQRALLYESMEKYKLGAEDLRTVMKIDPGNRVARSTVHRLAKMAE